MIRKTIQLLVAVQLAWFGSAAIAAEFRISDIRIQGLQRVSSGTVFNVLPVQIGDTVTDYDVRTLMRLLFESGYFDDIRMLRDGDVLIVRVTERPAIETIEIEGNKAIKTEDLLTGLGEQGLREGEIFKQATLERIGLELERQYVAQGRYDAGIDTEATELARNRVAILINVEEGKNSSIKQINLVGNTVYTEDELLDAIELQHPTLTNFIGGATKYSREKLQGDLEKLESYYQDRGYVEFRPLSTQVTISPDRQSVYLTINMREGEKYTVDKVQLVGDLSDVDPDIVRALFLVESGQIFNRARVTATEERIQTAFGNSGYTFASATGVPEVRDDGLVDVRFVVEAGKRAYVRRISFAGNSVTQDQVLRREMRQMEGGWASTAQIDRSKVRLDQLGYFEDVGVETPQVPGTDDQIDVDFSVNEVPTGSISATLGYSSFGILLGASYQQANVAGSGNSLGLSVSWSEFQKAANFNFIDPYFTADGISRGFNVYARETNFDRTNVVRFATNSYGVGVNFGLPIGETQRLRFGATAELTNIREGFFSAREISEYILSEGDSFMNYKLDMSWRQSALNSGFMPTAGISQSLGATVTLPGSDLEFYKINYDGQVFIPIFRPGWSIHARTRLGFGDTFGGSERFPFYEHYFSGGFGSVRGYERNTLGQRVLPRRGLPARPGGDPFGGNLVVEGSVELLFPMPFLENRGRIRPVVFFDAGNVFTTKCARGDESCFTFDTDELRYSVGFGVSMITGMGPMTFALTHPLNSKPGDEVERFSFEVGQTF